MPTPSEIAKLLKETEEKPQPKTNAERDVVIEPAEKSKRNIQNENCEIDIPDWLARK